jgi:nucleoside-triphosphatase
MSIYIFSRPVRSGKTTELMDWCGKRQHVAGLLMPDIDGSRKILDLESRKLIDVECTRPADATEPLIAIGRFYFYSNAFDRANAILLHALQAAPGWLVLDEAGKLELEGKGFYTSLRAAIDRYTVANTPGNLLVTVRDSLLNAFLAFFNPIDFHIIHQLEAIPVKP